MRSNNCIPFTVIIDFRALTEANAKQAKLRQASQELQKK